MREETGIIREGETYEGKKILWKITDISSVINREIGCYISPRFSFGDSSWHFQLYPENSCYPEFMCLYLWKEKCDNYSVEYKYKLKKFDGRVEHLGRGIFDRGERTLGDPCLFMKLSELKERKSELAPADVLTLICTLKRFSQTSLLNIPKFKTLLGGFPTQETITKQFGIIDEGQTYNGREIEWTITNAASVISHPEKLSYQSPSFSFAYNSWHFDLHPLNIIGQFVDMVLICERPINYPVKHKYIVKKLHGREEHWGSEIYKAGGWSLVRFGEREEFKQRMFELAPSDVLTLSCRMKCGTTPPNVLSRHKLKELKDINLDGLSQNFKNIFADKDSCDTILRVKDKEYKAHKLVLIARSSVFFSMFRYNTSEKETGIITILDCDPDTFQEFLVYLYCGHLEDISFSSACHLYYTSDKYDVQNLKELCVEYLIHSLTAENVCEVVIMADKYNDAKLSSGAKCFFNKNSNEIFATSEWDFLKKDNPCLAEKLLQEMPSMVNEQENQTCPLCD